MSAGREGLNCVCDAWWSREVARVNDLLYLGEPLPKHLVWLEAERAQVGGAASHVWRAEPARKQGLHNRVGVKGTLEQLAELHATIAAQVHVNVPAPISQLGLRLSTATSGSSSRSSSSGTGWCRGQAGLGRACPHYCCKGGARAPAKKQPKQA